MNRDELVKSAAMFFRGDAYVEISQAFAHGGQGLTHAVSKITELMADFCLDYRRSGWVAVSERLPTEDGDYLVRNAGGNCQVHRWNGCSWLENHGSPPEWMNEKAFSHWLPIPPKEEV